MLGRLLRLSLAPTAVADIAAGLVLGAGTWPAGSAPWVLMLASLSTYHGAMALNDWADRKVDAKVRPRRPIPSGAVSPGTALALGLGMVLTGPLLAAAVDVRAAVLLGGVAALALVYDLGARGPWLGPGLLALCRAGNLSAGLLLGFSLSGAATPEWDRLVFPAAYALYVFLVSRLGRLEDDEDAIAARRVHPRWLVAGVALLLLTPPLLPVICASLSPRVEHFAIGMFIAAFAASGLARFALNEKSWNGGRIVWAMGMALRRLLVFTATTAISVPHLDGALVGGAILVGYPVSYGLRKVFPPS